METPNNQLSIIKLNSLEDFEQESKSNNYDYINEYNLFKNYNYQLWCLVNNKNERLMTVSLYEYNNDIVTKNVYHKNGFNVENARFFYKYTTETNKSFTFKDSTYNVFYKDERINLVIPLCIFEDGATFHYLNLSNLNISYLPKNITVNTLNIENTKISFLGNNLNVKRSIYADNSQLVAIDNTVTCHGFISANNSLLVIYPDKFKDKIFNNKDIYVRKYNKNIKI